MTTHPSSNEIVIRERYNAAVNAITRPDRMVFCSQYLVDRWMRELGGDALAILLFLRRRCYYNRKTGEVRDTCAVTLKEIADSCQISSSTVKRQLASNEALHKFISWQEEFAVEPKRRGLRQAANTYTVLMDDPIHPDDLEKLEAIQVEMGEIIPDCPKERARMREYLTVGQIDPPLQRQLNLNQRCEAATVGQFEPALQETTVGQFEPALRDTTVGQFDPLYKEIHDSCYSLQQQSHYPEDHYPAAPEKTVVVVLLCEQGITQTIAEVLAKDFSLESIQTQIDALPYRKAKDKAAVLVKSIREGWALPGEYHLAGKKREAAEKKTLEAKSGAAQQQETQAQKEKEDQEIEQYRGSLSQEEQNAVEQEAQKRLRQKNRLMAERLTKNPQSSIAQSALESVRKEILSAKISLLRK